MLNILALTCDEFTDAVRLHFGKGAYHARAAYRAVYGTGRCELARLDEFSRSEALAARMEPEIKIELDPVVAEQREAGLTKYVTRLKDHLEIESVIVPMATHQTFCISTQAGCRMGCRFCQTATLGLRRNLSVAEIVSQVLTARVHYGVSAPNIVFMGMGEPLDNFENVVQVIRVLEDQRGLDIAKRHMTISTVGLVDGIRQLGKMNWPRLNLAVSLNASNDDVRSQLMPVNRAHPMAALRKSLLEYPLHPSGVIFIEYVLIAGINDTRDHARELAAYLQPLKTKVNVIPFNPQPGSPFKAPTEDAVERFCKWLVSENLFVRRRSVKGRNIMAACGQLGTRSFSGLTSR
jgi:23S rRNA (adenine2503-C2)-methyltransferase